MKATRRRQSLNPVRIAIRTRKRIERRVREARMFASGLRSPHHPLLAHLVPMRRCNLSCTYCNEFDQTSGPVPLEEVYARVDRLAELGAAMVHLSGGEPMLHPDLEAIIRRVRYQGMLTGLLTNGLLLSERRIKALNQAGLDHLQISIDNVEPDEVSKKSLRVLDKKLQLLAEFAEFEVNINSVLGAELENPEDALAIARRAVELGLTSTVGILHDHKGQLKPFSPRHREIYQTIRALEKPIFRASSHNRFQENMIQGLPNQWKCRAGSRYLYICEDGLVHYCSQQRGTPGIPLSRYSREDLERAHFTEKECAPYCTISCVHRVSWVDKLREEPRAALEEFFPAAEGEWSTAALPLPVRFLAFLFLPKEGEPGSARATRTAVRLLRLDQ